MLNRDPRLIGLKVERVETQRSKKGEPHMNKEQCPNCKRLFATTKSGAIRKHKCDEAPALQVIGGGKEEEDPIKTSVRYVYDLQKLRIQAGNRASQDPNAVFLQSQADLLAKMEERALKYVESLCRHHPINEWLREQKGVGRAMAGVIISEIDISRSDTISALWSYCGLAVDNETGKAVKKKKGQLAKYNHFLKTKLLGVLADQFVKHRSPWRSFYDSYKHRKASMQVHCIRCDGKGEAPKEIDGKKSKKLYKCTNCDGKGVGPWGYNGVHRNKASARYMIKMFLAEMWREWRALEGLPITKPYAEVYLGKKHGDHGHLDARNPGQNSEPTLVEQPT